MKYLFVGPVPGYPLGPGAFAFESAFSDHLRELIRMLDSRFTELVVAGPRMTEDDYQAKKNHLVVNTLDEHHLRFEPLYDGDVGNIRFWGRPFRRAMRKLARLVREVDLVHSGTSHELSRPIEMPALLMGAALRKRTISVTDLDLREDPRMMREVGAWSQKAYLATHYVRDPIRSLQHHIVARMCDLVLMKGERLIEDYGGGRDSVKLLHDPGFHEDQIISQEDLDKKLAVILDPEQPLELTYFGRFVLYKGVDRMIEAVAIARERGKNIRFTIIGQGDQQSRYEELIARHHLGDVVTLREPITYGDPLFAVIRKFHLLLAAPLSVDTPRSTWDAICCGLPILAFETEFYEGLKNWLGVVETVPWPSVEAYADALCAFDDDREKLAQMTRKTPVVAAENTQELWLTRRVGWTLDLF